MRFAEHRPKNEYQVKYLSDLENQRMKLETKALSEITNNVTMAGNITLENGQEFQVNLNLTMFYFLQTRNEMIGKNVLRRGFSI